MFLLTNSSSLTADETAELGLLQDEFPYSQVIHNLVARGAHLNNLPTKQEQLTKAAVYATDRSALKAFITAPASERKAQPIQKAEPPLEVARKPVETVADTPQEVKQKTIPPPLEKAVEKENAGAPIPDSDFKLEPSKLSGDALIDELFQDLDRLKKLKHDFEVAAADFDNLDYSSEVTPPSDTKEIPSEKPAEKEAPAADAKPSKKSKHGNEGLIAEIKSTKKKIKPSDPRQKEQLEIIDKFIKSKPSIGKAKSSTPTPDAPDLTESSSMFSENIVSETLWKSLIKQGKKEKAVEVLRKLIWKFPQKKAYFAAQIEELTN